MTRDDILRIARESGLSVTPPRSGQYDGGRLGGDVVSLERFAAMVAAAEREACASLIEDYERFGDTRDCAAAIRARNSHAVK